MSGVREEVEEMAGGGDRGVVDLLLELLATCAWCLVQWLEAVLDSDGGWMVRRGWYGDLSPCCAWVTTL